MVFDARRKLSMCALAAGLLAASGTAVAEWTALSATDAVTFYVDPGSIRKSGATSKMWLLLDFKKGQRDAGGNPYRSAKSQEEFDCEQRRTRTLFKSLYTRKLGADGPYYQSAEAGPWSAIEPESGAEALWKFACTSP